MRISDWSSDVCPSDLPRTLAEAALVEVGEHFVELVQAHAAAAYRGRQQQVFLDAQAGEDAALFRAVADAQPRNLVGRHAAGFVDRKGVGSGKGVAVGLVLGGRRMMKKRKQKEN